jgi:opacity protein-like surface antigen
MNLKSYGLVLLVFALFSVSSAHGQSGDWYASASAVFFDDDPDRAVGDAFAGAEFRVGYDITDHLTVDGLLGYAALDGFTFPTETYPDQTHIDFGANLLISPAQKGKFSPYLLVGLGYLNVELNPGGTDSSTLSSFGVGFDWRIGEGDWSIRSELRARTALDSTSHRFPNEERDLTDMLFTIGVKNNFGAPSYSSGSSSSMDNWYASGSIVYFDDDPDRALDAGLAGAQFHMGRDINEWFALEGTFGYYSLSGFTHPNESYSDQRHIDVGVNALYYPWRDWTVSPYVLLGLGYLTQDLNPGTSESGITGSFGLGFNWKIASGAWSPVQLRLDGRENGAAA